MLKALRILSLALSALVLVGVTSASAAFNYYVSPGGLDSRDCTTAKTEGTPKQTINSVKACLSPGDTLKVGVGTYTDVILDFPSGSAGNYIHVVAYNGTVVIAPSGTDRLLMLTHGEHHIEFDGINLDGSGTAYGPVVFDQDSTHDLRLQNAEIIGSPTAHGCANICGAEASEFLNLVIHGGGIGGTCGTECANYGFYTGGSGNILDGNTIYDVGFLAVQIYNGTASNNIIRNNTIYNIKHTADVVPGERAGAILVSSGTNNEVYNNVIFDIGNSTASSDSSGINVYAGGSGAKVWANTVYGVHGYGVKVDSGFGITGVYIQNNLLYGNSSGDINDGGTGTTIDHNYALDPLFTDASGGDFHVLVGSGAILAGVDLGSVTTDFSGASRPTGEFTIGAYQFAASSIVPVSHATGTIVVTDNFTGTTDTDLTVHTGSIGATWTQSSGDSGAAVISSSNRLRAAAASNGGVHYSSGVPATADYDVEADFVNFTSIPGNYYSIQGRWSTSALTGYAAQYDADLSRWQLFYWLDGNTYNLGTYTATLVNNATYHVVLLMRGSQITLEVEGVQIIQATDTNVTAVGRGAVNFYTPTTISNSTGIHLDNFVVTHVTGTQHRAMMMLGFSN